LFEQEQELISIYEQPLLEKLGLGKKFPRDVMYYYKNALGLGLMTLNTILTSLALKLYIGHTRFQSDTNELIEAQL